MVYYGEVCKHGINTTMQRCHVCGAESERERAEAAERRKQQAENTK